MDFVIRATIGCSTHSLTPFPLSRNTNRLVHVEGLKFHFVDSTTSAMSEEGKPLLASGEKGYGTNEDEESLVYTWVDLNVHVVTRKKRRLFGQADVERKHILKGLSGVARPGELLAILGSSGAGKTTLLNALTFRSPSSCILYGLRCANGVPLSRTCLTSRTAYVQQDDLFFPNLTVREHLIFHALVRMDRGIPYQQRLRRVDEVISELSLIKCQQTRIKNISGGERKRLAFAAEVLTDPPLMFCDEPTSGLDSFMALNVVQVLKDMAKRGKTVVCTIHQPSSELYALFDKVLYMADGRIAFLGTPDEADVFFTSINAPCPHNYNPADYYIQLLAVVPGEEESSRQAIDMICGRFEKSEFGEKIASAVNKVPSIATPEQLSQIITTGSPYKASWWSQFRAVFWRSWICITKEAMLVKVRLWQTFCIALIIGVIYFGQRLDKSGVMNINGVLFLFLISMTFQNVYTVVTVFCADFPLFLREHTGGMYRTDVYFLCRTLAELPVYTLIPTIYISICYYMIGLSPAPEKFFVTLGIAILVTYAVIGFGYLISCTTSSASMAMSVGPPLVIPFLLFGGFFLNVGSIPLYLKWLSYFSWFKYGNEALLINQWSDVTYINCTGEVFDCPTSGTVVLEIFNFSSQDLIMDVVMLGVLAILFRLLAYFALLCRTFHSE